jgi:hypothetical protein
MDGRVAVYLRGGRRGHLGILQRVDFIHSQNRRPGISSTSSSPSTSSSTSSSVAQGLAKYSEQLQEAGFGISLPVPSADALPTTLYGHSTRRPLSHAER